MGTQHIKYAKNASKLHRTVGECLVNSKLFSPYGVYQEVPVKKVNPTYKSGSHRFDYVIKDLKVVIECHGIQHYEVSTFGAEAGQAILNYHAQRKRDARKKQAAIDAGYAYIEVPFTLLKKIDEELIWKLYLDSKKELSKHDGSPLEQDEREDHQKESKRFRQEQRKQYLQSERHKETLEKARRYRKEQYERYKRNRNDR